MKNAAQLLTANRVTRIIQGIDDPRMLPADLIWSRRVPTRPAMEGEITARHIGVIYVADLIADDAQAVIRSSGRMTMETHKAPNLKTGVGFTQEELAVFARVNDGIASPSEQDMLGTRVDGAIAKCKIGVDQRAEHLRVAMLCDGVGFTYNRLGIQLTAPSWGMPSDLKVTAGTTWDVAGTATPVNDLWAIKLVAQRRYGMDLNRVTMSTPAFQLMIATTNFQNLAKNFIPAHLTFAANLNTLNLSQMQALASNVLGMQLELYDARFWEESTAGVGASVPYLPLGNVLMTNSANDGSAEVYDLANLPVVESIVARAVGVPSIMGNLTAEYGPVGYATLASPDLNPPGMRVWGVSRCWPRKFKLGSSAVLNIGTVTDSVSTALPF